VCFDRIEADWVPSDAFFLVDKSASMSKVDPPDVTPETRWRRAFASIEEFCMHNGAFARYGIGFAPHLSDGSTSPSCSPADYLTPAAELSEQTLTNPSVRIALDAQTLGGDAAGVPALDGALRHAADWFAARIGAHGFRAAVAPAVILVMGAPPVGCGSTVQAMAALASAAFNGPSRIRTFVVAVGPEAQGLDPIAAAGGTSHAYATPPADFDETLVRIGRALQICDIPRQLSTQQAAQLQVRARLDSSTPFAPLSRVSNLASCGSAGGWYFDRSDDPSLVMLCPSTCTAIIDAPAGQMVAGFPCGTDAGVPPPL
jgi:hypothetical protein